MSPNRQPVAVAMLAPMSEAGNGWLMLLAATTELNPVAGNLVFNGAITNGGYWINVYGASQKTLTLGGVLSGSGGVAVKQDSIVALTNNNAFTGAIWVEKGTLQAGTTRTPSARAAS